MVNKNYIAGRRFEYKVKKYYEDKGYTVLRTSGSHGFADLIAVRNEGSLKREKVFIPNKLIQYMIFEAVKVLDAKTFLSNLTEKAYILGDTQDFNKILSASGFKISEDKTWVDKDGKNLEANDGTSIKSKEIGAIKSPHSPITILKKNLSSLSTEMIKEES